MKRIKALVVLVLCLALLAFAGCGTDKTEEDADNGSVQEETMDETTDDSEKSDDGSAMDKMEDDAKDASDDVKDAVDGEETDKDKTTE